MSNIETTSAVAGVQCQVESGLTTITILPAALAPATHAAATERLRAAAHAATQGVIVDCRKLPKNAFEQTGPWLYEMLVAGRRRMPRLEICVVGRADQSTGESTVFVAPPRFETVEAAVSFMAARARNTKPTYRRSSNISDVPFDSHRRQPPTLILRVARVTGVVLVLGVTACLVAYSAMESFGKSQSRRSLALRELARTHVGTRLAIYGSIGFVTEGASQRDVGAAIVVWPAKTAPHKFALCADDVFTKRHLVRNDRIAYTTTDGIGEYVLTRRVLADFGQGNYCLLVLSANRKRSSPPEQRVLDQLAKYFASPEELLGEHEYRFEQLTIDALDPLEHNELFGEDELRPENTPLNAGETVESPKPKSK